jgi:uncharacterized protein YciI
MAYFVALLEYTENDDLRLRTRPRHREYLRGLLEAGKLRLSGPWEDETGAMLVYQVDDQAAAEALLAADPYRQEGVLANATVKEWRIVLDAAAAPESS